MLPSFNSELLHSSVCVCAGKVVCGLRDAHIRIIFPVRDVTHVRKCTRPSPLNCTASDGKLGEDLGMRLANIYNVQYTPLFVSPLPYNLVLDTQTLEQSAQNCTHEQVGQFLEGIGLSHHVATFIEQDVSGEMLLEANQEVLEELGVTSAIERLKIKVH